jgi:predicted peptidase
MLFYAGCSRLHAGRTIVTHEPDTVATDLANLPPGDYERAVVSTSDGTYQPFRLFVPTAITERARRPLLAVLHGKGVDHHAWFELTRIKAAAERHGYVVVAPLGRGKAYYNEAGEQDVLDIIAAVSAALPIDRERVFLAGHSMGGWGTWYISLRHPELFRTVCPMAAPVPTDLLPNAEGLDPLIIHDRDDPVVPVAKSRAAAAELARLGISHRYCEVTGHGHSSSLIDAHLEAMFAWFGAH